MFSNGTGQTLVHLPRQQQQQQQQSQQSQQSQQQAQRGTDQQLPRGECRFILTETDADGARQRCRCVSFSLNENVPGASCGCGHQAWHHVKDAANTYVPLEEHDALLERFKRLEDANRRLQEDLVKERSHTAKEMARMVKVQVNNLAYLRYYVDERLERLRLYSDDKVESVMDKAEEAVNEVGTLKTRLGDIDEATMRIEERMDSGRWQSRSLTPVLEDTSTPRPSTAPELPIRTESHHPEAWDIRIVLVPDRNQEFGFSQDTIAYRRCQTRGLHQDLHLQDRTSKTFVQCIENSFATIMRGRAWMPLQCLKSSDMSLSQLYPSQQDPALWDYAFLESQCMAHDKLQGDLIFICLKKEKLTWQDIYGLSKLFGSDESCWEHDNELDVKTKDDSKMDYNMDTEQQRPIDSDSMYEYSPPPYSSRALPDPARRPHGLDVLATASYMAGKSSPISSSSATDHSIDATLMSDEYDEHRDKRTKRTALRPPTTPSALPSPPPPVPQALYYSGRAKRKMPVGKQREPMEWRVSEMKLGNVKGLLHRHEPRDKQTANNPSSGPEQQQQSSQGSQAS